MKRILRVLSIVTMATLLTAAFTFAAPTVIKIAHPNVPQHPMGQCFEKFKELVEQRSDGKFRVDIYDSSKFGNFDSVVQGLQYNAANGLCFDSQPVAIFGCIFDL